MGDVNSTLAGALAGKLLSLGKPESLVLSTWESGTPEERRLLFASLAPMR